MSDKEIQGVSELIKKVKFEHSRERPIEIRFLLGNDDGWCQFLMATGWFISGVRINDRLRCPSGYDVGYHSPTPQYDGQKSMKCELLENGECYYDGSSLEGDALLKEFLWSGEQAIWSKLARMHGQYFGQDSSTEKQ